METLFWVVVSAGICFGLFALIFSDEADPSERLKESVGAALGGAMGTAGCLVQCAIAVIPFVIGLFVIGAVLKSCS